MNRTRTWATCVAILSLHASFAGTAQVLDAVPNKVDLGTFNTFQIEETTVKLKNTGRDTFLVDKVKANCACIRTTISTTEIGPGETTELKIAVRERKGGEFSHDVLIIPKDRERYEPLKIQATGYVVQPISARLGWKAKKLTTFDPNRPVNLGLVHRSSAEPLIHITANEKHFNLRDAVPDANSTRFELQDYRFEKIAATDQIQVNNVKRERLVLMLKPRKTVKTGLLRELIRITLADDVRLDIPISCRIVGDVYGVEDIIHLGHLSNCTPKEFTINFVDNARVWSDLRWDTKGYLSGALAIRHEEIVRTESHIGVTLAVDQSRLSSLPEGYVYCRIRFYQNGATDEAVNLLVDGFNSPRDI